MRSDNNLVHSFAFLHAGGMVLQTNMADILARIEDQNRLVKQEAGLSAAPAAVVHQLKSMNLPQQFKDMKLPDFPQAIKVSRYGFEMFWVGDNRIS